MCSVSLVRFDNNVLLTMNRDERRERHEAGLSVDDSRIFPVDGHAGGTWCGVNRHGLLAALLNRYQDVHQTDGTISRGTLIPLLMEHSVLEEAEQSMASLSLSKYNPFTLILADRFRSCTWSWNGSELSVEGSDACPYLFFSSSSIDAELITKERSVAFEKLIFGAGSTDISAQTILAAHVSRVDMTNSRAIFMDRDVSHTKSIVQIKLNDSSALFSYFDEAALAPVREGLHQLPVACKQLTVNM